MQITTLIESKKNLMIISIDVKNTISFHNKNSHQLRYKGNVTQHNTGYIEQTNT